MATSPSRRNTATTRAKLLEAARAEFAAVGIAGARVDRIAEKAGVNKERIYGHFGSKEKLFDAVITEALNEMTAANAIPEHDPGAYVAQIFDYHREHPETLRLILWEALHYRDEELPDETGRASHYTDKVNSLAASLGTDPSPETARLLIALIALAAYPHAVPQLTRRILGTHPEPGGSEKQLDDLRDFLSTFASAAAEKLSG